MILIADSGSTVTDWTLINDDKSVSRYSTKGMNPFFQSQEEIETEIKVNLLDKLKSKSFDGIYFYGAGCIFGKQDIVKKALESFFTSPVIEVSTDMLAAAHALCGNKSGIACILGTGSNSCFYNGSEILENVSPLGFILGDEGSGAVIGKLFIGSLLKNQLKEGLKETFLSEYKLEQGDIIDRVYRKPFPNRFLASLSPFILKHIEEPSIKNLVLNTFKDFFQRNVMQYKYQNEKVHFVGSIAYYFREILEQAAKEMGVTIGTIDKSPREGLINYHMK